MVIEFSKQVDLERAENIFITAEGKYNVKLDGKLQFGMPSTLTLPAGKHNLNIKVWNQATPPAIYVEGKTIHSDSSWKVTYEDKEWIDESGKASDTSATVYMNAGYWNFDRADQRPSQFMLCREPLQAVSREKSSKGELLDFGKETFGYITFKNLSGKGSLSLYYGESKEEALDTAYCETLDRIQLRAGKVIDLATNEISAAGDFCLGNSKAFRYVYIEKEPDVQFDNVGMEYEYLPVEYRGASVATMKKSTVSGR